MVSVLYRHAQNLRHVSPQNRFSLKEFESTTREIGLIIFLGKLLIQSLEWLVNNFSETHHFTDHVKDNWENPFSNVRTLCKQNIESNSD